MSGIQEARYVQIVWQDRTTAIKVVESRDCLRLDPVDASTVEVEVVSYSVIDNGSAGQFAIRLDDNVVDAPRVELANGAWLELRPVTNPATGVQWWIEGKTWDQRAGRWLSDIYRGVGEARIQAGVWTCRVKVAASTFTHDELERYLRDFQTDFWELILDDCSYLSAAARRNRQNLLDTTTLRAISRFIESANVVLRNPKAELREVQRLKPRREVRPVARTFMEMATRGTSSALTSRAYEESSDVAENRYAHYALRKVYQITKALCTVCSSQARSLERSLEGQRQRFSQLSGPRTLNREAVQHEVKNIERQVAALQEMMSAQNAHFIDLIELNKANAQGFALDFSGTQLRRLQIRLGKRAEKFAGRPFFANIRSSDSKPWYAFEDGYATVEAGIFSDQLEEGCEYEVIGALDYTRNRVREKIRHNFEILSAAEFKLIKSQKYEKLVKKLGQTREKIHELEKLGWQPPLSHEELEQRKRESASVGKTIALINRRRESVAGLSAELQPQLAALRAALRLFEKANIKVDSKFPDSMSYVQNPAYQGVHAAYLKIREGSGVGDDDVLLAIERMEEIGLVNVSMLYERWCLLQIIKVLFRFQYRPEPGWKRKLTGQILDQGRNVAISFVNPDQLRELTLTYEMELDSGKRPDFVLDVAAYGKDGEVHAAKRFVMDAKFYQDIDSARHGGLTRVVDELYNGKNYAENGKNAVFILHPTARAAGVRSTPQDWSRNDYYGEVKLFDWSASAPNHRYGGIFLSPAAGESYLTSLQRAIGMFLQYGMENNDTRETEHGALPEHGLFCIACGSANVHHTQSSRNAKAWWVTCNECQHFATYNHCHQCGNRLIKNGEYWSYHAMEPLNPTNIKCPSCESML